MYNFFSGIITRERTFFDFDTDSYEALIKKYGLDDSKKCPDFVRVELFPGDKNIFNHDLNNWKLKIDQDFLPEWFNEGFAEFEMKEKLKLVIKEKFIINQTVESISKGRYFVGDGGRVENVLSGGVVEDICDGGIVENVLSGGVVEYLRNGGIVEDICDGGIVKNVYNGGIVRSVHSGGVVEYLRNGGIVEDIWDGGVVKNVYNGGIVRSVHNGRGKYIS